MGRLRERRFVTQRGVIKGDLVLQVCTSNAMERLVHQLIVHLESQRRLLQMGPFEPIVILVPDRPVEVHLKHQIVRHQGVCANLRFLQPFDYFEEVLARAPRPAQLLERRSLRVRAFEALRDPELRRSPELLPALHYLGEEDESDTDAFDRRLIQLAGEIARHLDAYSHTRAPMLDAWSREELLLEGTPGAVTERWQAAIWRWILEHLERDQTPSGVPISSLSGWIESHDEVSWPAVIHVFGLNHQPNVFASIYEVLARRCEVIGYALDPCREFWQEMRFGRPEDDPSGLLSSASVAGGAVEYLGDDSFWATADDAPMTLKFWGFAGALRQRTLRSLSNAEILQAFEEPEKLPETLLERIQYDTLSMHAPLPHEREPIERDRLGIRVLAVPTVRREVEIIANEIWSLVRENRARCAEDPSLEELGFQDIAVWINPAQRDIYQMYIRSVFPETHRLPFNMIDMDASRYSRAVEAVHLLLSLPFGEFRRQELLRLLTHPNVTARFGNLDPEQWLRWCDELRILHGADRSDHEDTYIQHELFHWDQGLRRLTLGALMTGKLARDRRAVEVGGFPYLPHEYAQGEISSAARLVTLARSLIADARFCRTAHMPLADWGAFLCRMVASYLTRAEDDDVLMLHQCREQLSRLQDLDASGEPVSYRIAYELALDLLRELEVKKGQHQLDGVVVAALLPDRAIPFKVVFLAGMNEGSYPEPDPRSPEDLRFVSDRHGRPFVPEGCMPEPGLRERQKFTFLETLLSVREQLVLSYVSRDPQTGERREPSSLVSELFFLIEQDYLPHRDEEGYEDEEARMQRVEELLVTRHELRRFHERYFPQVYPEEVRARWLVQSAQPEAEREARVLAMRHHLQEHLGTEDRSFPSSELLRRALEGKRWRVLQDQLGLVDPPRRPEHEERSTLRLSTFDVRSFLECPLQASAKFLLGLRSEEEEALLVQNEIFETHQRARSSLLRDVFLEKLGLEHQESRPFDFEPLYDERARYFELEGLVPTGPFYRAARQRHLRMLTTWQENLVLLGLGRSPKLEMHRFGTQPELELIDVAQDPIVLDVDVPVRDGVRPWRVELSGRTSSILPELPAALLPHSTSQVRRLSPRYFMRGFLDQVFLAALGREWEHDWSVYVNPGEEAQKYKHKHCVRRFAPMSSQEARGYLQDLLVDMLAQVHAYYLPIEVVFEHWEDEIPLEQSAAMRKASSWMTSSSDYGPIRHPERFEVPDDAARMIERRYGPFFQALRDPKDR